MSFYPSKVQRRFLAPLRAGMLDSASAKATNASFECGTSVSLSLEIDGNTAAITEARFATNGCGYMSATSDLICEWLSGRKLGDLHGLSAAELDQLIGHELGPFPKARLQCAAVVFEAVRKALANYRRDRIEEFQGEKALVCTCFGVTEETLVDVITGRNLRELSEVTAVTRAGSGCGSCGMLIQELIDANAHD